MDDSIRRAKLKRLDQIREQKKVHLKEFIQKRMKQDPENLNRILTNPTDIIGKINNTYLTVTCLIFIFIASLSSNLIAKLNRRGLG